VLLKLLLEKLTINVDVRAATFYPSVPIINVIPKILKRNDGPEKSRDKLLKGLNDEEIEVLNKFLKGVRFLVTLRDRRKQEYKVSFVDEKPANRVYPNRDRNITVVQQFRNDYGRPIQYGNLPCLVTQGRRKLYFPFEVCEICPIYLFK